MASAGGTVTLIAGDIKVQCSRDPHDEDEQLRFSQFIKETMNGQAPGLGVCPSCLSKRHVEEAVEAGKKRRRDEMVSNRGGWEEGMGISLNLLQLKIHV